MNSLPWLVREPKMSDVPALAAIATAVSPTNRVVTPSQITQWGQQTDGRFWTITQQDEPIGYATLLPLPGLPHLLELSGGIAPASRRQGAGSFLWNTIQETVRVTATATGAGQAVRQITHTVDDLASPAAYFLRYHRFVLEHEEWTMRLDNLASATLSPPQLPGKLKQLNRAAAVRALPTLYERCFAGTPWFQPYTAAEVAATWQAEDELWALVVDNQTIGFAWLHFSQPNAVEIEPIGIVREKQGMGYGRFLLTTLLQQLQYRNIQTVSLGVWAANKTAVRLYQSVGFGHVSSSYSLTYTLNTAS